jgi:hypothetical protein
MDNACRYADRPVAFLARYVMARPVTHAVIMTAVLAAVGCSVGAQYGIKVLVDILAGGLYGGTNAADAWLGFLFLTTLIPDNTDRRGQPALAARRLDRQLDLRRRDRRFASRPVPPLDRARAQLLRRSDARHVDEPGHGDIECRLHVGEHVRLERASAVRGNVRCHSQ